jgi:hypothetical protein
MRAFVLLASLALVPLGTPAHADSASVVAHGWGFGSEEDEVYTSRGFCDAVAIGVAVQTTVTCYFANAIGDVPTSVTATGSTPNAALATLDAVTEDRGLWCWTATSVFVDGSVAYYPSRNHYECALL